MTLPSMLNLFIFYCNKCCFTDQHFCLWRTAGSEPWFLCDRGYALPLCRHSAVLQHTWWAIRTPLLLKINKRWKTDKKRKQKNTNEIQKWKKIIGTLAILFLSLACRVELVSSTISMEQPRNFVLLPFALVTGNKKVPAATLWGTFVQLHFQGKREVFCGYIQILCLVWNLPHICCRKALAKIHTLGDFKVPRGWGQTSDF